MMRHYSRPFMSQRGFFASTPLFTPGSPYPPPVVRLGLQTVWDLRTTVPAGIQAPNKSLPADAGQLPAGSSINGLILNVTQSATFDKWNFAGYQVACDGNITVAFTNCKFSSIPTTGALLQVAVTSGDSIAVTCSNCEFTEENGRDPGPEAGIEHRRGDFTVEDSWLHNATADYFSCSSVGTFRFRRNYMRAPAKQTDGIQHIENFHSYDGTQIIELNLIDINDMSDDAAWTSIIFPNADAAGRNLDMTIYRNVIVGCNNAFDPLLYSVQLTEQNTGEITCDMTQNVIEEGLSGLHVAKTGGTPTLSGTSNYDFFANTLITEEGLT